MTRSSIFFFSSSILVSYFKALKVVIPAPSFNSFSLSWKVGRDLLNMISPPSFSALFLDLMLNIVVDGLDGLVIITLPFFFISSSF